MKIQNQNISHSKNPNKPIKKKVFQANEIAAQSQPILAAYEELEKAAMNIIRERNRIPKWEFHLGDPAAGVNWHLIP